MLRMKTTSLIRPASLIRGLLLAAILCASSVCPSARALPSEPLPEIVSATSTNIIFYVYGLFYGRDVGDAYTAQHIRTKRDLARGYRDIARMFMDSGPAFSYFWGVADGLDEAANLRGEP
jgi:hypothetical protein